MRWIDSAMFNQLPPNGVYNGIMPCAHNHSTMAAVLCPAQLSHTSRARKAGSGSGKVKRTDKPSCHAAHCFRLASGSVTGPADGSAASFFSSSSSSQAWRTTLVTCAAGWTSTVPVAGSNQRHHLRRAAPNPFMRLCSWMSLGLPPAARLRYGLKGSGFLFAPNHQTRFYAPGVGALDQLFWGSVSTSLTVTA